MPLGKGCYINWRCEDETYFCNSCDYKTKKKHLFLLHNKTKHGIKLNIKLTPRELCSICKKPNCRITNH